MVTIQLFGSFCCTQHFYFFLPRRLCGVSHLQDMKHFQWKLIGTFAFQTTKVKCVNLNSNEPQTNTQNTGKGPNDPTTKLSQTALPVRSGNQWGQRNGRLKGFPVWMGAQKPKLLVRKSSGRKAGDSFAGDYRRRKWVKSKSCVFSISWVFWSERAKRGHPRGPPYHLTAQCFSVGLLPHPPFSGGLSHSILTLWKLSQPSHFWTDFPLWVRVWSFCLVPLRFFSPVAFYSTPCHRNTVLLF